MDCETGLYIAVLKMSEQDKVGCMKGSILLVVVCTMQLCSIQTFAAQRTLPDLIEQVRQSVVQVTITIPHPGIPFSEVPIPEKERAYFAKPFFVLGTGVFINSDGVVLTAAHVAQDAEMILADFAKVGVKAIVNISVQQPNVDSGKILVAAGNIDVPAVLVGIDPSRDVSALRPLQNPFKELPTVIGGVGAKDVPRPKPLVAKFGLERPRDGQSIFACGFPKGSPGLITTSGSIASAWNSENLVAAQKNGSDKTIGIYQADLRINPGNSGGPVFRESDQALIGIVVEIGPDRGGLGIIVPAKEITAFLSSMGIAWTAPKPLTIRNPNTD